MATPTPARPPAPKPGPHWRGRLVWFAALWCGGVSSVALVSFVLRLWIAPR